MPCTWIWVRLPNTEQHGSPLGIGLNVQPSASFIAEKKVRSDKRTSLNRRSAVILLFKNWNYTAWRRLRAATEELAERLSLPARASVLTWSLFIFGARDTAFKCAQKTTKKRVRCHSAHFSMQSGNVRKLNFYQQVCCGISRSAGCTSRNPSCTATVRPLKEAGLGGWRAAEPPTRTRRRPQASPPPCSATTPSHRWTASCFQLVVSASAHPGLRR